MAYPSLEQYNESLQSPQLVLQDPELKGGRLKTSGLGLPLALCGGFALTYSVEVGQKRYALRCFHKESRELERRYQAISTRLKQLASPYFLPFDFIPNGIRVQGGTYPIVKMAWAQGRTLAEFLESEHKNTTALEQLRQALIKLAAFLEQNKLAHGDIQPENLMVSADGATVQLIDYDGMFVEALRGSKATELGQINFQHPGRTADDFDEKLDRFSFLTLDVALQALIASASLWTSSRSEPSALVFRRNDFLDPGASPIFQEVVKLTSVKTCVENMARAAAGDFSSVPSLSDFLQGKGSSSAVIVFKAKTTPVVLDYQAAYPVCNATNYSQVLAQVGSRVELVGQIHSVKKGWAANKKPYVFVNFTDWRGEAVKLAIWFDGMKLLEPNVPDESWVGSWVSVTGLVDPPYHGNVRTTRYSHLSITISASGQIQTLSQDEAEFRLRPPSPRPKVVAQTNRNTDVLINIGVAQTGTRSGRPPVQVTAAASPPPQRSSNQQLLATMRAQAASVSAPAPSTPVPSLPPSRTRWQPSTQQPTNQNRSSPSSPSKIGWGSWIGLAIVLILLIKACAR